LNEIVKTIRRRISARGDAWGDARQKTRRLLGGAWLAVLRQQRSFAAPLVMSQTTELVALAFVQPLHGFTFALLHLACMRMIAVIVPVWLAATAQSLYALGAGLATALLILVSGRLYGQWGGDAFLVMALLCAAALPADINAAKTPEDALKHSPIGIS